MNKLGIYSYISIQDKKKKQINNNRNNLYIIKYIPLIIDDFIHIFNNSKFISFNNNHSLVVKYNNYCIKIILFDSRINYSINYPYSEIEIIQKLLRLVTLNKTPHLNIPLLGIMFSK